MRKAIHYASLASLAALLTACASSPAASPSGNSDATASATSSASPVASGPAGILPVPAGATAWTANTNKAMSLDAFVHGFYTQSSWSYEEGLNKSRGFKTGALEGWFNADGSQQSIAIARFASAKGAVSMYDGLTYNFREKPKPATMLTYSAIGGLGWSNPTLDADGMARSEMVARVGDAVIDVIAWSASAPDATKAKSLLLEQYNSLKNGA